MQSERSNIDLEFYLFSDNAFDFEHVVRQIVHMTRQENDSYNDDRARIIRDIRADAKFLNTCEILTAFVRSLDGSKNMSENDVRERYEMFNVQYHLNQIEEIARAHGVGVMALRGVVEDVRCRKAFHGTMLDAVLDPLNLGWKAKGQSEMALMSEFAPLLRKMLQGRPISGLEAYS